MRFIQLTQQQVNQLEVIYRESANHRERQRAQGLLLSNQGYKMAQLAELFTVDRDTISNWFNSWQAQQEQEEINLQDAPRSGRPSGLSEQEKKW